MKTYRDYGFLYSTGTLLAPQYKLYAFDDTGYSKFENYHNGTSKPYCEYLRTYFVQYQEQVPKVSFRTIRTALPQLTSELGRLLIPARYSERSVKDDHNGVDQYPREGKNTKGGQCLSISDLPQDLFNSRREHIRV